MKYKTRRKMKETSIINCSIRKWISRFKWWI